MNRINKLFTEKQNNIFSVFFTAGHPHIDETSLIIEELQNNGVEMIEIGIPFSDPMADGKVIQESSTTALKNGMTLRKLFDQLKDIRKKNIHIPLLTMGYLNPIMQFGFDEFCNKCIETGIDGMVIPDLPFRDYIQTYKPVADKHGLKIIMLITPETSEERIREIDINTDGFIYMVSTAATTGTQNAFDDNTISYFQRIKRLNLRNPLMIGFGISNKEMMKSALENANGAIVGSKFVKLLDTSNSVKEAVEELKKELF